MIRKALYSLGIPLIALGYSTAYAAKEICIAYVEENNRKLSAGDQIQIKLIDEKSMGEELIGKLLDSEQKTFFVSSNGLYQRWNNGTWLFNSEGRKNPPEKFNSYTKDEINNFIKTKKWDSDNKIKESDAAVSGINDLVFTQLKAYWEGENKVITKFEDGAIKTVDFNEFFKEEEPVQLVQPDKEEGNHDNLNPDKEEEPVQPDNGEGNHDGDATKIQQGLSGKLFSTKSFAIAIGFVVVLGILWKILEPFKKQNKSKSKKAYKQKGPITAPSMKGSSQN